MPLVLWWLWKKDVIRPSSFSHERAKGRIVAASPMAVWPVAAFGLFLAQGIGTDLGLLMAPVPKDAGAAAINRQQAVAGLCGAGGAALVGLALCWFFARTPWGERAGMSVRPRARDGVRGLGYLLVIFPIVLGVGTLTALVSMWVTGKTPDRLTHEILREINERPWAASSWGYIIAAVVLAPIAEEVLFRGMLQTTFLRLTASRWAAVLSTGLIFAAIHLLGGTVDARALAPLFVLGVALGIAYERTGRLWVPIAMHMLFNAANVAITLAS